MANTDIRSGIKSCVKRALAKMARPGHAPIEHKLDRVLTQLNTLPEQVARKVDHTQAERIGSVWRGGLEGRCIGIDGKPDPIATDRTRQELQYWVDVARDSGNPDGEFPDGLEKTFLWWQEIRLYELARALEFLAQDAESIEDVKPNQGLLVGLEHGKPIVGPMAQWLRTKRVVEIGGGPIPCVAAARFASAHIVDPLAEGYLTEGLVTEKAAHATWLSAVGEMIPLPSQSTDLVLTDNCLDHVRDPARVVGEMARILVPGGFLWLLVDVMEEADQLHPNPMDDAAATRMLTAANLERLWGEVWPGHSHPRARGQWRTLWRKPVS